MADVATHPIHEYTDKALNLANILIEKIGKMTPIELDALLHPLFQEDEFILIMCGAALGAGAGFFQWFLNIAIAKWQKRKKDKKHRLETS